MESIKELPPRFLYYVGVFAYCYLAALFIYFTYQGYITARTQKFLSLDLTAGECETVPNSITSEFLGSSRGLWSGTLGFFCEWDIFILIVCMYNLIFNYYCYFTLYHIKT